MNPTSDPLVTKTSPDRLHYSTGELLGADDFRAEQTYHRRQLARALLYLHGSGTIAGLQVVHKHMQGANATLDEVEIRVKPGLALDYAGRLIEVPRDACLRLRRWYDFIARQPPNSTGPDAGELREAFRAAAAGGALFADVFLSFHECPRGYTPAFASGPFDSLDASQPSRVRDAYELTLVVRKAADPLTPARDLWAGIAGANPADRLRSAKDVSLTVWDRAAQPPAEIPPGVDATAVLLARVRIPAQQNVNLAAAPVPDWSAAAWPAAPGIVDNRVREIVLSPAVLRRVVAP